MKEVSQVADSIERETIRQLMERGWILCCSRRSSPHHYYLQSPTAEDERISLDHKDVDWRWTRESRNSRERLMKYPGADSRKPMLTQYVLRKRAYTIKRSKTLGGGRIVVRGWFRREEFSE